MLSENAKRILEVLQKKNGMDLTAKDVADELGLKSATVIAIFNSFVKKGLGFRQIGTRNDKEVKYLRLTDKGLTYYEEEV